MNKIYYTLTQAAKATGKHKSTVLRALQADKIQSTKDAHGSYQIDAEGLHAVYPLVVRTDSATDTNATERTDATAAPVHNDAQPLRTDAEALRTSAVLESEQAVSEQKSQQIDDLRSTVADLQSRLDQSESDRRQLETDRRQADENATRQVDQLSQLLAMKEKSMQTLQLEHQGKEQRGLWSRVFG